MAQKKSDLTLEEARQAIDPADPIPVTRQCELLGISRSAYYYQDVPEREENLAIMQRLDAFYLEDPTLGVLRMCAWLRREGWQVNQKRVRRLLRLMNLLAVYPKPRLTLGNPGHQKHPNRLATLEITRPNQVWASDITYVPFRGGYGYVVAILDLYSRYLVSWAWSLSLDVEFCVRAVDLALSKGCPEIFHSDQGVQYTCEAFGQALPPIVDRSMSGKGRAFDNILVERLWRSYKYEEVYLRTYESPLEAQAGAERYFRRYNEDRLHQALDYRTPTEAYGRVAG